MVVGGAGPGRTVRERGRPFPRVAQVAMKQDTTMEWMVVNWSINAVFIVDMVLQFFMAYQESTKKGGTWVTHRPKIVKHYLRTWFPIDLVSVFPFQQFSNLVVSLMGTEVDPDDTSILRAIRTIRLIRLVKLLRILRASRIINRWKDYFGLSYAALSMISFISMTVFIVHARRSAAQTRDSSAAQRRPSHRRLTAARMCPHVGAGHGLSVGVHWPDVAADRGHHDRGRGHVDQLVRCLPPRPHRCIHRSRIHRFRPPLPTPPHPPFQVRLRAVPRGGPPDASLLHLTVRGRRRHVRRHRFHRSAELRKAAGSKCPRPRLTTPPQLPAWWLPGLSSLRPSPKRRSVSSAARKLATCDEQAEYGYMTVMLMFGSFVWAYVIGSFCSILASRDPQQARRARGPISPSISRPTSPSISPSISPPISPDLPRRTSEA